MLPGKMPPRKNACCILCDPEKMPPKEKKIIHNTSISIQNLLSICHTNNGPFKKYITQCVSVNETKRYILCYSVCTINVKLKSSTNTFKQFNLFQEAFFPDSHKSYVEYMYVITSLDESRGYLGFSMVTHSIRATPTTAEIFFHT